MYRAIYLLAALTLYTSTLPAEHLRIDGERAADSFGWAITAAGDVNGDGVQDLLVGAPTNDAVDGFAGRAYLFHGPFGGVIDATDASAVISAEAFGDNLGIAVAAPGDVDGDGFDDLLIGARSNDTNGIQSGRTYLFRGPLAGAFSALDADAIVSGAAFDELGRAVSAAGDLDGDGAPDLLMSAPLAGAGFVGEAYVFLSPISGDLESDEAGATISGVLFDEELGTDLAAVGDATGDGAPDIALGAPKFPLDSLDTGRVYLFSAPFQGELSALEADAILFGEELNDSFGDEVAAGGDIDGDGNDDLIVGAEQLFRVGAGRAYVFYGPLEGNIQAADAGAILLGERDDDLFGSAVSSAGDFNGDGLDDVLVAAGSGGRGGRVYLFFGPVTGTLDAASADRVFDADPLDRYGQEVASFPDLDGDGSDEILIGAAQAFGDDPGYVELVFGSRLRLTRSGACPGTLTLQIDRATPNAAVGLVRSGALRTMTLESGPCVGTRVDLDDPSFAGLLTTDAAGSGSIEVDLGPNGCNQIVQAVDAVSCRVSGLARVGSGERPGREGF